MPCIQYCHTVILLHYPFPICLAWVYCHTVIAFCTLLYHLLFVSPSNTFSRKIQKSKTVEGDRRRDENDQKPIKNKKDRKHPLPPSIHSFCATKTNQRQRNNEPYLFFVQTTTTYLLFELYIRKKKQERRSII